METEGGKKMIKESVLKSEEKKKKIWIKFIVSTFYFGIYLFVCLLILKIFFFVFVVFLLVVC